MLKNIISRNFFHIITLATFAAMLLPLNLAAQDSSPWFAPPDSKQYKSIVKGNKKSIAAGKKVYMTFCFVCHGEKGDGKGASASAMTPRPADFTSSMVQKQTDGELAYKILAGRNQMPAWETILNEEQIWSVIIYIRTFKK